MTELHGLQLRLEELRASGATVVAISPDAVERNRAVAERLGLDFPILADVDLEATRAFGVLHAGGGPDGRAIPRPATFIIANSVVRWRNLTTNFRIRPRVRQVLEASRAAAGL